MADSASAVLTDAPPSAELSEHQAMHATGLSRLALRGMALGCRITAKNVAGRFFYLRSELQPLIDRAEQLREQQVIPRRRRSR